jgi:hypothetical protein
MAASRPRAPDLNVTTRKRDFASVTLSPGSMGGYKLTTTTKSNQLTIQHRTHRGVRQEIRYRYTPTSTSTPHSTRPSERPHLPMTVSCIAGHADIDPDRWIGLWMS